MGINTRTFKNIVQSGVKRTEKPFLSHNSSQSYNRQSQNQRLIFLFFDELAYTHARLTEETRNCRGGVANAVVISCLRIFDKRDFGLL